MSPSRVLTFVSFINVSFFCLNFLKALSTLHKYKLEGVPFFPFFYFYLFASFPFSVVLHFQCLLVPLTYFLFSPIPHPLPLSSLLSISPFGQFFFSFRSISIIYFFLHFAVHLFLLIFPILSCPLHSNHPFLSLPSVSLFFLPILLEQFAPSFTFVMLFPSKPLQHYICDILHPFPPLLGLCLTHSFPSLFSFRQKPYM